MTSVIVIVILFFVFGITVGVISVIAMSARRRYKWNGPSDWSGQPGPDEQPPDLAGDRYETEEQPWWKARDDD
jgi:hypothetical protein